MARQAGSVQWLLLRRCADAVRVSAPSLSLKVGARTRPDLEPSPHVYAGFRCLWRHHHQGMSRPTLPRDSPRGASTSLVAAKRIREHLTRAPATAECEDSGVEHFEDTSDTETYAATPTDANIQGSQPLVGHDVL